MQAIRPPQPPHSGYLNHGNKEIGFCVKPDCCGVLTRLLWLSWGSIDVWMGHPDTVTARLCKGKAVYSRVNLEIYTVIISTAHVIIMRGVFKESLCYSILRLQHYKVASLMSMRKRRSTPRLRCLDSRATSMITMIIIGCIPEFFCFYF